MLQFDLVHAGSFEAHSLPGWLCCGRREGGDHLGERRRYLELAEKAARWFYYQRCGTEVPGWHRAYYTEELSEKYLSIAREVRDLALRKDAEAEGPLLPHPSGRVASERRGVV
ncbi:MAG TPA: hypothetical protein EYP17_08740 [Candidatus Latescibacteria bacterium]|nr:hypothetical protein [Candidatus Latescibacterota bacterium]